MSTVTIRLDGGTSYEPGSQVRGEATWSLTESTETMNVRLFWFTEGKGDRDMEIIDETSLSAPAGNGSLPFSFTLPHSPYSFSGKLITLTWAIEAVAEPIGAADRVEIVLGPNGQAKVLGSPSSG